jgi:hypothetical protein
LIPSATGAVPDGLDLGTIRFNPAVVRGDPRAGRLIFFVIRTVLLKLLYGCYFLRRAEATLSGATRSVTDFANPTTGSPH